jgi:hypothetical protein
MKLRPFILILFLISLQISSLCYAEDYEHFLSVKTRYGLVHVVPSYEAGPYDTIKYRDGKILQSKGSVFSLGGYLKLKDSDVVLVHEDCGGSRCMDSEKLYLIILKKSTSAKILTQKNFTSEDATRRLYKRGETVFVDLGFQNKSKKYAELQSDKIAIHIESSQVVPMKTSSCESLFDYSSDECSSQKRYYGDCNHITDASFSLALMGSIEALSNHPGFNKIEWHNRCVALCEGKKVSYDDFKKSVCSIK